MYTIRPFPSDFRLKNIAAITGDKFDSRINKHGDQVARTMNLWFQKFRVYDEERQEKFLTLGRFDHFAALSFPDADLEHLETCLAFFFWAFSADDLSDEVLDDPGDNAKHHTHADKIEAGLNISRSAFEPQAPRPDLPYAAMLHDLMHRLRKTATKGTCTRFREAFEKWGKSLVEQCENRTSGKIPLVKEFIPMRRNTIGGALVEAMIEYSLDLDIPDFVFHHPIIIAMSEATNDIMTWPNDLCSFNVRLLFVPVGVELSDLDQQKEQADGDLSNLVCCIMAERGVELQDAVDILTSMIKDRVAEYIELKAHLPSFGTKIDEELGKYILALEHFCQGTIIWYYNSPRYFKDSINLGHDELFISLYPSHKPIIKIDHNGLFNRLRTSWSTALTIGRADVGISGSTVMPMLQLKHLLELVVKGIYWMLGRNDK